MADITETTRRNILAAFKENGWKAEWMRTDTGREYLAIDGKPQWSMDWVGRYSGRLMKTCKWVARRRDEFDGVLRKVNELVKRNPSHHHHPMQARLPLRAHLRHKRRQLSSRQEEPVY